MAKQITSNYYKKPKNKRKGIHAKSKQSSLKSSKLYSKKYKGQGKQLWIIINIYLLFKKKRLPLVGKWYINVNT